MSSSETTGPPHQDGPAPRSETTDRYLETIYYIENEGEVARPGRLAEWLGVSAPTVSVSLQRLARNGWVEVRRDRSVELTDAGREVAGRVVRRHRIIERWLTDVLGLDWASADREAAVLAHGISDVVLERLDDHLGRPSTCPHGNLIPGHRPPEGRPLLRLSALEPGATASVARISEVAEHEAPHLLSVLDGLGIVPGVDVAVTDPGGDGDWGIQVAGQGTRVAAGVIRAVWVQRPVA